MESYSLFGDEVGVFYSPSQQGKALSKVDIQLSKENKSNPHF